MDEARNINDNIKRSKKICFDSEYHLEELLKWTGEWIQEDVRLAYLKESVCAGTWMYTWRYISRLREYIGGDMDDRQIY